MGLATGCPSSLVMGLCQLKVALRMWNVFLVKSRQILESSLHVSVRTFYESPSPWQTYQIQPSNSRHCTSECQHQTVRHHCLLLILRKTWKGEMLNYNKYVTFSVVAWSQARSVMSSRARQEDRQWGINGNLVCI